MWACGWAQSNFFFTQMKVAINEVTKIQLVTTCVFRHFNIITHRLSTSSKDNKNNVIRTRSILQRSLLALVAGKRKDVNVFPTTQHQSGDAQNFICLAGNNDRLTGDVATHVYDFTRPASTCKLPLAIRRLALHAGLLFVAWLRASRWRERLPVRRTHALKLHPG